MSTDRYDDLIEELRKNRKELIDSVLPKIVSFREKIDNLTPDTKDYKSRFALEQKMKSVTEILNSELNVRKHIDESVKTEFDLLRKASGDDTSDISISKLAEAIESMNKYNDISTLADEIDRSES